MPAGTVPRDASGRLKPYVIGLFFAWGFSTVLMDSLVPRFKALFALSYAEVMLTQFSFFLAYFFFSLPAGALVARVGYVRGIVIGLAIMTAGCLLFIPASSAAVYPFFLAALFVLAAGITVLQVAANPLIAVLGPSQTSHSRLNLAQAFNSLGTFVGPYFGAWLILGSMGTGSAPADPALRAAQAHTLELPFLAIAVVLAIACAVFVAFWNLRLQVQQAAAARPATAPATRDAAAGSADVKRPRARMLDLSLLRRGRTGFGVLSIFLYVGAEVYIGSLLTNYLMSQHTLGLAAASAGRLVSLYWGGAMLGRLVGSALMRRIPASALLSACAVGAAVLASVSALSSGSQAAYTALAIGLCNSIMFPTIFSLSIEGLGERVPQGSSLLCLAIVGGAVIPLLAGKVADLASPSISLFVPVVSYVWIAVFGLICRFGATVND
ncbi:MAG TPA: sugar MFS transporter [Steroidobacteraceae bacterium]|nr:sugar MFS transporter [Steroidobacteraceae bacterium]